MTAAAAAAAQTHEKYIIEYLQRIKMYKNKLINWVHVSCCIKYVMNIGPTQY